MDFRERLINSLHYVAVQVDKMMMTFMCCVDLEVLDCKMVKAFNPNWDALR